MQRIKEKVRIQLRPQCLKFGASLQTLCARGPRLLSAEPLSCLDCIDDAGNGDLDQQAGEEPGLK